MTGPRIITEQDPVARERDAVRHRFEGQSGVRPLPRGGWVAIEKGRYAGEFHGKRAFLAAVRAAGSDRRLV